MSGSAPAPALSKEEEEKKKEEKKKKETERQKRKNVRKVKERRDDVRDRAPKRMKDLSENWASGPPLPRLPGVDDGKGSREVDSNHKDMIRTGRELYKYPAKLAQPDCPSLAVGSGFFVMLLGVTTVEWTKVYYRPGFNEEENTRRLTKVSNMCWPIESNVRTSQGLTSKPIPRVHHTPVGVEFCLPGSHEQPHVHARNGGKKVKGDSAKSHTLVKQRYVLGKVWQEIVDNSEPNPKAYRALIATNYGSAIQGSHLCNHGGCLNPGHLEWEDSKNNQDRKQCRDNLKDCTIHDPPCFGRETTKTYQDCIDFFNKEGRVGHGGLEELLRKCAHPECTFNSYSGVDREIRPSITEGEKEQVRRTIATPAGELKELLEHMEYGHADYQCCEQSFNEDEFPVHIEEEHPELDIKTLCEFRFRTWLLGFGARHKVFEAVSRAVCECRRPPIGRPKRCSHEAWINSWGMADCPAEELKRKYDEITNWMATTEDGKYYGAGCAGKLERIAQEIATKVRREKMERKREKVDAPRQSDSEKSSETSEDEWEGSDYCPSDSPE